MYILRHQSTSQNPADKGESASQPYLTYTEAAKALEARSDRRSLYISQYS